MPTLAEVATTNASRLAGSHFSLPVPASRSARPGVYLLSTVEWFGGLPGGTQVKVGSMRVHYDELALFGVYHLTSLTLERAFRMVCNGVVDTKPLITHDDTLTLHPTNDLFFREITLRTTYSCNHIDTVQALQFIAGGRINARAMITHRFGLDRVADGIALIKEAGESIKILIKPALTPGIGEVA